MGQVVVCRTCRRHHSRRRRPPAVLARMRRLFNVTPGLRGTCAPTDAQRPRSRAPGHPPPDSCGPQLPPAGSRGAPESRAGVRSGGHPSRSPVDHDGQAFDRASTGPPSCQLSGAVAMLIQRGTSAATRTAQCASWQSARLGRVRHPASRTESNIARCTVTTAPDGTGDKPPAPHHQPSAVIALRATSSGARCARVAPTRCARPPGATA